MREKIVFVLLCCICAKLSSQSLEDTISTKNIQEVVIKGKKKAILQTDKGILLNVAGSVLEQKENLNDILKFAPNVSQVNGIKILGSNKIQIILNNKEVKIKPEQYSTFFSSIDAKSIKSIEIVDKPDAGLDSKYTSQIVITTKTVEGYTANVGMGMSYSNYFGQNSDASFIATFGKLRLYTSGNFFKIYNNEAHGNSIMKLQNGLYREGSTDVSLNRLGYNATINLDYEINKKNQISFLYNYTVDEDLNKLYTYKYKITSPIVSDSTAVVKNFSDTSDKTHTFSLQYVYVDDDLGSKLTINTDYAIENFTLPLTTNSKYFNNQNLSGEEEIAQNSGLNYHIFTTSADYRKVFKDKGELNFGVKYSNSNNKDILDYYNSSIFSPNQSQHFNFYENIYSAFVKYAFKAGSFRYNLGVRNEYTDNNFRSNKNISGNNNYNSFLPSATVYYTINKNNTTYLNVSKLISRPDFFSYDPTILSSEPNQISSGNQNLKPVDTYRLQAGYTLKQRYNIILQYLYSKNNIIELPNTIGNNVIFIKPENGGYQNSVLLVLNIPIRFTNFWESTNKVNFQYRDFRIAEQNYFTKDYFATLESTQSFSLLKKVKIDVDLMYSTPNQYQFLYNYSNFRSSVNVMIPVFSGNGTLRFGLLDIFNSDRSKWRSEINGVYQYERLKFNTRTFFLKFSYNFKSGKDFNEDTRDNNINDLLNRAGK